MHVADSKHWDRPVDIAVAVADCSPPSLNIQTDRQTQTVTMKHTHRHRDTERDLR